MCRVEVVDDDEVEIGIGRHFAARRACPCASDGSFWPRVCVRERRATSAATLWHDSARTSSVGECPRRLRPPARAESDAGRECGRRSGTLCSWPNSRIASSISSEPRLAQPSERRPDRASRSASRQRAEKARVDERIDARADVAREVIGKPAARRRECARRSAMRFRILPQQRQQAARRRAGRRETGRKRQAPRPDFPPRAN